MSIISMPWPYVPNVGPTYSADDWANVWAWLARDGRTPGHLGVLGGRDSLRVEAEAFPQIIVRKGAALVGGRFVQVQLAMTYLSVSAAHPTYERIDLVVLRTNANDKSGELVVKEGTPGPAPVAPTPVQDGNPYFELPLCEIHVRAGATSWLPTDFQDVRRFVGMDGDIILDVYIDSAITQGAPVFLNSSYPSNRPFVLRGTSTPAESTLNLPLLGVALESRPASDIVPVLSRGLTVLRPAETTYAGDHLYVSFLHGDLTQAWVVGRTIKSNTWGVITNWGSGAPRSVVLGTALTTANAGEQCLVWVDPLAYWSAQRVWTVNGNGDVTITSTTWTVVSSYHSQSSRNQVRVRSQFVEVGFAGVAKHSAAGGFCHVHLALDNTVLLPNTEFPALGVHQLSAANQWQNVSCSRVLEWAKYCAALGLHPQGTYTLRPAFRTNTGTLTILGSTGSPADSLPIWNLWLREVHAPWAR